jgi:hypothetical protein
MDFDERAEEIVDFMVFNNRGDRVDLIAAALREAYEAGLQKAMDTVDRRGLVSINQLKALKVKS